MTCINIFIIYSLDNQKKLHGTLRRAYILLGPRCVALVDQYWILPKSKSHVSSHDKSASGFIYKQQAVVGKMLIITGVVEVCKALDRLCSR